MNVSEFKIPINDQDLKKKLISQEMFFRSEMATNRKAKDCLTAIIQLKLSGQISHFFALRLLGQLEDQKIIKPFFKLLKVEFEKAGLKLAWHNNMLMVSPLGDLP